MAGINLGRMDVKATRTLLKAELMVKYTDSDITEDVGVESGLTMTRQESQES